MYYCSQSGTLGLFFSFTLRVSNLILPLYLHQCSIIKSPLVHNYEYITILFEYHNLLVDHHFGSC